MKAKAKSYITLAHAQKYVHRSLYTSKWKAMKARLDVKLYLGTKVTYMRKVLNYTTLYTTQISAWFVFSVF